jgi:glycosyltransferase involved in cell wall biosynthesis
MRILWVKAGKLLPVDTGGKIRSFNILRQLARRHEVTLLTYYGGARDTDYERQVSAEFSGAVSIHTAAAAAPIATALDYAGRVLSRAPYAVTKFTAAPVRRLVHDWLTEGRVDVAVCDFLSASLNFPADAPVPRVLFQHNVESVLWARQAREERHPLKRLLYRFEAFKMASYERAAVGRFDQVIAVSEADRSAMSGMTDPGRISLVATGVDTSRYKPAGHPPQDGLVLFVGSMDWQPNVDGVSYFCETIWPRVRRDVPHATFRVVGRNPGSAIRRLASDSVEISGTVSSVVEHLQQAAVVVVPLRIGGGTRLKIYEAMGAGRAVVSTTIGAEGLDVDDGRDIVLADEPAAFADAVVRLLRQGDERRRFERAALQKAAQYDWRNVGIRFEEILERAVRAAGIPARENELGATA